MAKRKYKIESRSGKQRVEVCLVSMPFKDLRHPPLQLGILQSCLIRAGITVHSCSFELAFMEYLHEHTSIPNIEERITTTDYQHIACHDFIVGLGDWIFKVAPYYESASQDEEYLQYIRTFGISEKTIATAVRMRKLVPGFLNAAADEILARKPSVVGFSTVFQQNVASLVLSKILKEKDPLLTIVFGGGNCDGLMGAALHENFPWIDVVVRGEGELVFIEVVRDVINNRAIHPQTGLCYRHEGKPVVIPQGTQPQVPISEVPAPIYDEFFELLDKSPVKNDLKSEVAILFESSRGCWWGNKSHCTFCGLNGTLMKYRAKPAEQVLEEILDFAARYKILDFVAVDDIVDPRHIRDLLPMLKASGCDFQIFYETKSNLRKDQLTSLYSGGVTSIQPGIESLSTPILQLIKKGVTALQNIRLLKWCTERGIVPAWNILYGFPGEPPGEYERMAKLIPSIVHFEPPAFLKVQLERFSPYFDHPAEFGIEIDGPQPHYKFLYPVSEDALNNIAYEFDHIYIDGRDPETYIGVVRDEVERWQKLKKHERGYLNYRRGPDFLIVEDRRAGFEKADYRFDGIEAKIYLACNEGAKTDQIVQLAVNEDETLEPKEIEEYLNDLVEARLLYQEGDQFLSLAVDSKTHLEVM